MIDLIIIGAGPSGLTAAVYATRAGLDVLILERGAPGGKVFTTHLVENYPGFESISGPELSKVMHKHAMKFGAKYEFGSVEKIVDLGDSKKVITNVKEYEAKTVLIATGTENRHLGASGEVEMLGKGVSYCAICDGNFFKGKDVIVVGGGNSAMEESLYLSKICSSVSILYRGEKLRASKVVIEKVQERENINIQYHTEVVEIVEANKLEEVIIINNQTQEKSTINASGIFIYIGLDPAVEGFLDLDIIDERGQIKVNDKFETPVKGIYASGDVLDKSLRQITTAVGEGSEVANNIINALN